MIIIENKINQIIELSNSDELRTVINDIDKVKIQNIIF